MKVFLFFKYADAPSEGTDRLYDGVLFFIYVDYWPLCSVQRISWMIKINEMNYLNRKIILKQIVADVALNLKNYF